MQNNSKSDERVPLKVPKQQRAGTIVFSIFLCIILCAATAFGAYFVVTFSYQETLKREVYIDTAADFKAAMSKKQFPMTEYILRADITLTAEDYILEDIVSLAGVFNGQGHRITTQGDRPLFDRLRSSGIIRNLTVRNADMDAVDSSAAILVRVNDGLIENCAVVNSTIRINALVAYAAGIAAHNFGTVKNCLAEVRFAEESPLNGRFSAGGIAAVSYKDSKIENALASTAFSQSFTVLANALFNVNETNTRVGYLVGEGAGDVINSYACDVFYANTATDIKNGRVTGMTSSGINQQFVFDTLTWLLDYWNTESGKLPTLKVLVWTN